VAAVVTLPAENSNTATSDPAKISLSMTPSPLVRRPCLVVLGQMCRILDLGMERSSLPLEGRYIRVRSCGLARNCGRTYRRAMANPFLVVKAKN
jgi:hypothetical protein